MGDATTNDFVTRLKAALSGPDGEIDAESVRASLRDAAAHAGKEIDTDAIMARVRDVAGTAEDKLDSEKLRHLLAEAESGKLGAWLTGAKGMAADAASKLEAHGERLSEQAPGTFDKLMGTAKAKLGAISGNDELAHQGELDRLKGQIKDKYAGGDT